MLAPNEVAKVVASVGEKKANLPWWKMIILGMFAGAFIALAGVGATFANVYVGKIAGALVFPAGLAMVVVAGSELFTGNNLMVIGLFDRKFGLGRLVKNWILVFLGNLLGAVAVAGLVAVSGVFDAISDTVMATASAKVNFGFASVLLDTLKKYDNKAQIMLSSSIQATLSGRFGDSEYGRSKKRAG